MGMFEGLSSNPAQEVVSKWIVERSHNLSDTDRLCSECEEESESGSIPQHVFVLSEQRMFDRASLTRGIQSSFPGAAMSPRILINLAKLTSEKELKAHLSELLAQGGSDAAAFCMVLLDCAIYCAVGKRSRSNSHSSSGRLEQFLYAVKSFGLPKHKHVVLIAIVQNSSTPGNPQNLNFQLHLDLDWMYLFIDKIYSVDGAGKSVLGLEDLLQSGNNNPSQLLVPEAFCDIAAARALTIAQRICGCVVRLEETRE